jgi:hypothetical protein
MNPLIGPKLNQRTLLAIKEYWGFDPNFGNWTNIEHPILAKGNFFANTKSQPTTKQWKKFQVWRKYKYKKQEGNSYLIPIRRSCLSVNNATNGILSVAIKSTKASIKSNQLNY